MDGQALLPLAQNPRRLLYAKILRNEPEQWPTVLLFFA